MRTIADIARLFEVDRDLVKRWAVTFADNLALRSLQTMSNHTNLFDDIPSDLPEEVVQTILSRPDLRIERIVSHGHASPTGFWYDQDHHEWVMVLKGAARLSFEEHTVGMKPGDFVNIPAHKKHRVEWTTPDEPTIWLAVHYGDGA